MATHSPVSTHAAWKTTPKEPLPTTRFVSYEIVRPSDAPGRPVVTTCPASFGSPSMRSASYACRTRGASIGQSAATRRGARRGRGNARVGGRRRGGGPGRVQRLGRTRPTRGIARRASVRPSQNGRGGEGPRARSSTHAYSSKYAHLVSSLAVLAPVAKVQRLDVRRRLVRHGVRILTRPLPALATPCARIAGQTAETTRGCGKCAVSASDDDDDDAVNGSNCSPETRANGRHGRSRRRRARRG